MTRMQPLTPPMLRQGLLVPPLHQLALTYWWNSSLRQYPPQPLPPPPIGPLVPTVHVCPVQPLARLAPQQLVGWLRQRVPTCPPV